jgi:CubicO group peptidase (beta-lactamase class C family)
MSVSSEVDALVARFVREFEIPGAAVAIVLPGQPATVRAYGQRSLGDAARVDEHTQFAIGSNSKAFLTASLAMLVDEGRLSWQDRVVKHLPEFQMHDPAVTAEMTVLDLLLHRSGLPLGAGDLMLFPPSDHTPRQIMEALRHLKLIAGFRTRYTYDNILYIVAGLVLERASGLSWDRFVAERIFQPLGMTDSVASPTLVRPANLAGRHARLGPPRGHRNAGSDRQE